MSERKVISVGDLIKDVDRIEMVPVGDFTVPIRIKKPSANDSLKTIELVNMGLDERKEVDSKEEFDALSPDERMKNFRFSFLYDATVIASSCFHPDQDGDGNFFIDHEKDPRPIWNDAEDVLNNCTKELFEALRARTDGLKAQIKEGDIKK